MTVPPPLPATDVDYFILQRVDCYMVIHIHLSIYGGPLLCQCVCARTTRTMSGVRPL